MITEIAFLLGGKKMAPSHQHWQCASYRLVPKSVTVTEEGEKLQAGKEGEYNRTRSPSPPGLAFSKATEDKKKANAALKFKSGFSPTVERVKKSPLPTREDFLTVFFFPPLYYVLRGLVQDTSSKVNSVGLWPNPKYLTHLKSVSRIWSFWHIFLLPIIDLILLYKLKWQSWQSCLYSSKTSLMHTFIPT